MSLDEPLRHAAAIAADDQMRAEARDRLRRAPLFFASIGDEDGHRVLGSTCAPDGAALGFLLLTIASVWDWISEMTGDGDAEIACRLMHTLAARRADHDDGEEGRDAEDESC
jgi:hypothetical protein